MVRQFAPPKWAWPETDEEFKQRLLDTEARYKTALEGNVSEEDVDKIREEFATLSILGLPSSRSDAGEDETMVRKDHSALAMAQRGWAKKGAVKPGPKKAAEKPPVPLFGASATVDPPKTATAGEYVPPARYEAF